MAFNIKDFVKDNLKISQEDVLSGMPNGKKEEMDYREIKEIKQKVVLKMVDLQSLNDVVSEIKDIVNTQKINIANLKSELEGNPEEIPAGGDEATQADGQGEEGVPGSEMGADANPSEEGVVEGSTGDGGSVSDPSMGDVGGDAPAEGDVGGEGNVPAEGGETGEEPTGTEGGEPSEGTEGSEPTEGGETPEEGSAGDQDKEKDQATDQAANEEAEEIQSDEGQTTEEGNEESLKEDASEEEIKEEDQKSEASMERFSGKLGYDSKKDLLKSLGLESRKVRYAALNNREKRIIKYWNSLEENKDICRVLSSVVFSESKAFRVLLSELIDKFNSMPMPSECSDSSLVEGVSNSDTLRKSVFARSNLKELLYRILFLTPDFLSKGILTKYDLFDGGMIEANVIGFIDPYNLQILTYPKGGQRGLISKLELNNQYNSSLEQEAIFNDLGSQVPSDVKIVDNIIMAREMIMKLHETQLQSILDSIEFLYGHLNSPEITKGIKLSFVRDAMILNLAILCNTVLTAIVIKEELNKLCK